MNWQGLPELPTSAHDLEKKMMHAALTSQKERGAFLFCIPLQVGPATPYARNVRHWFKTILLIQVGVCIARVFMLKDIVGGFWMILLCILGVYALREDMNITYVCCWGLFCGLNSLGDILGLTLSLLFDLLKFNLFDILLRVLAPLSELLGAFFAWHLYLDYFEVGGGKASAVSGLLKKMPDPMGRLVETSDPKDYKSMYNATKDAKIKSDFASPFKKMAEVAASFRSPKPTDRVPRPDETQGWQQHGDAVQQVQDQQQEIEKLQQQLHHAKHGPVANSPFDTQEQGQQEQQSAFPAPPSVTRKQFAACC